MSSEFPALPVSLTPPRLLAFPQAWNLAYTGEQARMRAISLTLQVLLRTLLPTPLLSLLPEPWISPVILQKVLYPSESFLRTDPCAAWGNGL